MRLNSVGRKEVSFFAPDIRKKLAVAGFMPVLERIDCAIILLTERPFLS